MEDRLKQGASSSDKTDYFDWEASIADNQVHPFTVYPRCRPVLTRLQPWIVDQSDFEQFMVNGRLPSENCGKKRPSTGTVLDESNKKILL